MIRSCSNLRRRKCCRGIRPPAHVGADRDGRVSARCDRVNLLAAVVVRNMLIWLRRHNGAILFGLTLVVAILLLANAWKHNFISATWLKEQKDALSAVNSIATTILFIAGAIFSYYRFFRGRLLSLRAELSLSVSVHSGPGDNVLHAVTLTVKNVGSSTIWNPTPYITVISHEPDATRTEDIAQWETPRASVDIFDTFSLVESDETVSFFAIRQIQKRALAVTYMASVSADTGDTWFVSCTVTNTPS
jgi:hypothetical protein